MKALVVYESMWGNTEAVARAIAEGMAGHSQVSVARVGEAQGLDEELGLVVAGGPTHAFSMTRPSTRAEAIGQGATGTTGGIGLREWLDGLPHSHNGPAIATFDTKVAKAKHLPGAAKKAAKAARRHGYRIARTETFFVQDVEGPLVEGELERARAWGQELATSTAKAG